MRYEFYAAILGLLTAFVNGFNGNHWDIAKGREPCRCEATCQSGISGAHDKRESPSETGTVPYQPPHNQSYGLKIVPPSPPEGLSAGTPTWLASWSRQADRAERTRDRRAACASIISIGNRLNVDERLASEDRRAMEARTEKLRELCPYLDQGGP